MHLETMLDLRAGLSAGFFMSGINCQKGSLKIELPKKVERAIAKRQELRLLTMPNLSTKYPKFHFKVDQRLTRKS